MLVVILFLAVIVFLLFRQDTRSEIVAACLVILFMAALASLVISIGVLIQRSFG